MNCLFVNKHIINNNIIIITNKQHNININNSILLHFHLLGIEAVLDVAIDYGEGCDVDGVHNNVHQIGIGLRDHWLEPEWLTLSRADSQRSFMICNTLASSLGGSLKRESTNNRFCSILGSLRFKGQEKRIPLVCRN